MRHRHVERHVHVRVPLAARRVAIAGAAQATYTTVLADLGRGLRCEVSVGAVAALSQTVTTAAPVALAPPEISGDNRARGTLRCSTGSWDGTYTYGYRWLRDGAADATTSERVLTPATSGTRSRAGSTRAG